MLVAWQDIDDGQRGYYTGVDGVQRLVERETGTNGRSMLVWPICTRPELAVRGNAYRVPVDYPHSIFIELVAGCIQP